MKSLFEEIGMERVNAIFEQATRNAAMRAKELGLPEAVEINGVWMLRYPDGHLEIFKSFDDRDV